MTIRRYWITIIKDLVLSLTIGLGIVFFFKKVFKIDSSLLYFFAGSIVGLNRKPPLLYDFRINENDNLLFKIYKPLLGKETWILTRDQFLSLKKNKDSFITKNTVTISYRLSDRSEESSDFYISSNFYRSMYPSIITQV